MKPVARVACGIVVAIVAVAGTAFAQTKPRVNPAPDPEMWRHGSTLNLFGGAAGTSTDLAPMGGAALGWGITPRVALEGSGTWYEWGHRTHAFAATLRAQVALMRARPVMPFLSGGVGLYRASEGMVDSHMPDFYRRRMPAPDGRPGVSATFMDPSLVFGGGVNLFVTRHVAIRPDLDTTIVIRDGRTHVVTGAAVHLAYHFEDHPITP